MFLYVNVFNRILVLTYKHIILIQNVLLIIFFNAASFSGEHQSTSVSSYVTLRRGPGSSASRVCPNRNSALDLLQNFEFCLLLVLLRTKQCFPKSCFVSSFSPVLIQERPHSALDLQLSSNEGLQSRGRMTAEEQLERMKRHQRALVRERKRNLSQGDHSCLSTSTNRRSSSSSRLPSSTSDPPVAVRYPTPPRSSSHHREQHLHRHCCYATIQPPDT